ncbi:hypothetical protein R5R35_011355 [Gryllus longicercus]|uniref:Neural proliferation differentiation and control protein 1 n=1 Tax=Gryllus longicercus TaxID=2509291 RepID=A0AAN9W3Z9_9ORTH
MRSVLLWFAFYISTHCGVGADIELYPVGTPDDYPLEELSVILREKPELFVTREQLAAAAAAAEAAAEAEAEAEAAAAAAGRREYPREASSLARLRLAPAPDAVGPAPQYAPRRQPAFSYREPAGQAADGQPAPFAVSPEDPRFYEEPRAQSPELDGGGGAYRAGDFGFRVPSPEEAPPRSRPDTVQGALEQAPPPPAAPPAARDADEEAWRLRLNFRQAQQPPPPQQQQQQQQQAAVASAPPPAQQEAPPPDTKKKASQEAASSVEAEAEAAARAAVQAAAAAAPQADMAAPPVAELRGGGGAGAAGAGQVRPAAVANPFEDEDEEEAEGPAAEVLVPQASKPQRSSAVQQKPVLLPPDNSDLYFIAIVAGCCAAAVVGIIAIGISWYRLQKSAKAAADVEYPAYGVTGPNKDVSPTGDRRLAQSAQMYHYQHQKQQIIAMESRIPAERNGSVSDAESEEENEEGDYTVYECPGLAPTGEMEVKNPMFHDDPTPATPAAGPVLGAVASGAGGAGAAGGAALALPSAASAAVSSASTPTVSTSSAAPHKTSAKEHVNGDSKQQKP